MADGADHSPFGNRATITPEPALPEKRKPAFKTVMMAKPLAFFKIFGGIISSGPANWFGLINEARTFAAFLEKKKERGVYVSLLILNWK